MGQRHRSGDLIRNTVHNLLTEGTDGPSYQVEQNLFYHHKSIDMAIDFKKVAQMTDLKDLLTYPEFREQYVWLYDKCHKGQSYYIGGEAHYESEIGYLKKIWMDNEEVKQATVLSIALAMIDLAYHGLTIQPISKTTGYLVPRPKNLKKRKNDPDQWEKRVVFVISAYGELELRRRSGIIVGAKNPQMVYEGDIFEPRTETKNGHTVTTIRHIPMKASMRITHAYIVLILPGGYEDVKIFSIEEIQAFRKLQRNENMRNAASWTGGIDGQPMRGTIEAKVIKHAFSTYPRLNLGGSNASLATDSVDYLERDASLATVMAGADGEDEGYVETDDDGPYNEDDQEITDQQEDEDLGPFTPPTPPVQQKAPPKKQEQPAVTTKKADTTKAPGFNF